MASRQAGAAGRSRGRQRVVNQPSASVTELGICSKELRGGESLSLMKETSVLIESGYSPAARDRPRRLIHISCFVPLRRDKAQCKRWGSPAQQGWEPKEHGGRPGEGRSQGLQQGWAGTGVWELGWVLPGSLQHPREDEVSNHLLSGSGFWGGQQSSELHGALLRLLRACWRLFLMAGCRVVAPCCCCWWVGAQGSPCWSWPAR